MTGTLSPLETSAAAATCRSCGAGLKHTFVDLGMAPRCERYLRTDQLDQMEPFYPLHVWVCDECFLVQLPQHVSGEPALTALLPTPPGQWVAAGLGLVGGAGLHILLPALRAGANPRKTTEAA